MLGIVLESNELRKRERQHFQEEVEELQMNLSTAAHEFRGPLHNVLSISAAMCQTTNSAKLDIRHKEMTDEIYRAKRIVDNYLVRGVKDQLGLRLDFQLHDLRVLLNRLVSRFHLACSRRKQRIIVSPSIERLPKIVIDRDRIEQVLANVIDNAIKYGFANTDIFLEGKDEENFADVSVTDVGLGVPPNAVDHIFHGYQRSPENGEEFRPGTGLGLAISKRLLIEHGGDIRLDSVPCADDLRNPNSRAAHKVTFTVSLPKVRG